MPFYKTNDHLLCHYKRIMNGEDAERKRAIQGDHDLLTELKDYHRFSKYLASLIIRHPCDKNEIISLKKISARMPC